MEREEYQKKLAEIFADVYDTLAKKNHDYAGEEGAFACFEKSAKVAEVSVEQGIIVRIMDKINRIMNLLYSTNEVKNEAITDTARDLIGYSAILALWLQENTKNTPDDIPNEPPQEEKSNWFKKLFS